MASLKFKGKFSCNIIKKNGETLSWQKDNMITLSGYAFIMSSMFETNNRPAPLQYIAFGSGTTPTDSTMTSLENELVRVPAEWSWDPDAKVVTLTADFEVTDPMIITEAGIFNASSGGIMFDRVTFSPKGIDETDTMEPVFEISVI